MANRVRTRRETYGLTPAYVPFGKPPLCLNLKYSILKTELMGELSELPSFLSYLGLFLTTYYIGFSLYAKLV